jgi:hypothetical protein
MIQSRQRRDDWIINSIALAIESQTPKTALKRDRVSFLEA